MEKIIIKIIGYFFLSPAIVSIIFFFLHLNNIGSPVKFLFYNNAPTTLHVYLGLMAVVGAYLIKENKKNISHTI